MRKLQLTILTLLMIFNLGCKNNNQEPEFTSVQKEEVNIGYEKEAIKDTIRRMINTYEYKDLAILFGGRITTDIGTSTIEADDIWIFADENPHEFVKWYTTEIEPKHQYLQEKYNGLVYVVAVLFVESPEKSINGEHVNYQTKIYTTDPIEYQNFTEEKEYKLLDKTEKNIRDSKFPGWPIKVTTRYIRKFYSYPEASEFVYDSRN